MGEIYKDLRPEMDALVTVLKITPREQTLQADATYLSSGIPLQSSSIPLQLASDAPGLNTALLSLQSVLLLHKPQAGRYRQ